MHTATADRVATKKGKHLVTSAQTAAILKDLENRRQAMPSKGMTGKQILSAKKKRETANGKILTAQFKGRQPPKKSKAQIEAEDLAAVARKQGKKGHTYDDLSSDQGKGQQAMRSTVRADIQSAEMGKPRKKDESWWVDTLNFIGRPMFATAEAANDNQEKYYRERHKGKSKISALGSGLKAGFGGWVEGIKGEKKTTFSDVIQESANNRKANRLGVGAERDDEVGPAKVNPFLKHGVGFALDVFADPLTYVGVGAVTKAAQAGKILKGEEVAQNLIKTSDLIEKVSKHGAIDKAQLNTLIGSSRAPVEQIKRLDKKTRALLDANPEAKAMYEAIRMDRKTGPKFKRLGAAETRHYGKLVETGVAPRTAVDFSDIPDPMIRGVAETTVAKELSDYPGIQTQMRRIRGRLHPSAKRTDENAGAYGYAFWDGHTFINSRFGKNMKEYNDYLKSTLHKPEWHSSAYKTTEELTRHTIVHEIGHQASWAVDRTVYTDVLNKIQDLAGVKNFGDDFKEFIRQNLSHYPVDGTDNIKAMHDEIFAEGWAEFRIMGDKARPLAKLIGESLDPHLKALPAAPVDMVKGAFDAVGDRVYKTFITNKYHELLDTVDDTGRAALTDREAWSLAQKAAVKEGLTSKQIAADLLAATERNLNPQISKQLRVRVGNKSVGVAGTENFGKILAKMNQAESVNKAVKVFNDTFRAMAKVNPTLGMLRNQGLGQSSNRVSALLYQHEKTWNVVNIADRKAIWRDWRAPTPNGSTIPAGVDNLGNPIDNAVEHVDEQIQGLQDSVDRLGITPNEIGAWISGLNIRLDATTAPGWKIGPTGSQARIGGDASKDWLINFLKHNDSIEDPGTTLFALHAALEHSIAKRSVNQSAAQHFGVPVAGGSALSKTLRAQGYKAVDDIPGAEGMLFHPDIAEGLVKVNAIMNDRITMDKWLRGLDQATLAFKGAVTRYNPSFHVRTLASEFMLSYIGGMRNPLWAYPKAAQVMRGRGTILHAEIPEGAVAATDRAGINAQNAFAMPEQLMAAPGDGMKVVFRHPKFGNLTSDQVWGLFRSSGLKTGFATTDVQRSMNPVRSTNPLSKANASAQRGFENVEDFGRLAHFMDILKTSKHKTLDEAVAEAAETVLKYHLDYTAVTQFEKSWMNRAMPFYKWLRLSTPMILESMAHNPGKALVAPKALSNMSEMSGYDVDGFGIAPGGADALTPGFLREAGALPMFNAFGDNQYFNPAQTIPMYGLGNESNQNPINKLNPFGKIPVELMLNKSAMGPPPRDEGNLKRYLLGQTPQTNLGQVMADGDPERAAADVDKRQRLLSFLANPGLQPATPRRVEGEAQMEWDRASKHRRAVKKQLGIE